MSRIEPEIRAMHNHDRSSTAMALLLAGIAALTGCRSPARDAPLWETDLGLLSREALERSTFRADGVLVQGRHELRRLDPATGAVQWSRPTAASAFPAGELGPVWVPAGDGPEATRLEELDPATGATRRQVPLAAPIAAGAALTWAGAGRVLVTDGPTIRLVDAERGATLWERTSDGVAIPGQLLDDRALVWDGATHRALALRDGSELWRRPGVCCAEVSPDPRAIYLPVSETRSVRVDLAGEVLEEIDGAVVAVDSDHVAVLGADALVVRPHGDASPAFTLARPRPDAIAAVALRDGSVFYFRGDDDTLWRHELGAGRTTPVTRLLPGGVVSPDGSGAVEPNLDVPPAWAPPYLFVAERRLQAFRLPR